MAWRLKPAYLAEGLAGLTLLPVLAGLAGTGVLAWSGNGMAALAVSPGLVRSAALSLGTGLAATILATSLALLIIGALAGTPGFSRLRRLLSPLLALPHAAAALGLAFLFAPSGWIARALSPWATGWTVPPDLMILNDPYGISLTLGLAAKEVPFLLLMALTVWPQMDAPRRLMLAASLGHGRITSFAFAVLPAMTRAMRLPIHAVLAYSMTSVDMALVLGPTLPAPLAVQILRWTQAPSLADQPKAAAGGILLLALVVGAIMVCEALARISSRLLTHLAASGHRATGLDAPGRGLARSAAIGMTAGLFAGQAGLVLWSVAGLWPFPQVMPSSVNLDTWTQATATLTGALANTAALGFLVTILALCVALALLQSAGTKRSAPLTAAIYLPLLIPQITLMPGLSAVFLRLGTGAVWPVVTLGHLVFVLPYVLLSLTGPWRSLDVSLPRIAASLGASPARIFWRLRLPMLLPAILNAAALGFAVSIGQYLPTLLLSGGRIPTLTTEALALASGGNHRLIGAFSVLQMALPAVGFLIALILPRVIFAHRKGMLGP